MTLNISTIFQLMIISLICISPFWFLASKIDNDELIKTAFSIGMVTVAGIITKMFDKLIHDHPKKD